MPAKAPHVSASFDQRQEDYISPVAHAQMILNSYKGHNNLSDDSALSGFMRLQQMVQVQSTDNTRVEDNSP